MTSPDDRRDDPPEGFDELQARRIAQVGALLVAAIVLLVFVVENSHEVKVSFVFFTAHISLIWVILLSAVAGAIAGAVVPRLVRRRYSRGKG